MTKKSFLSVSRVLPLLILLGILLTGCGCKHEWAEATCTAPKTCSLCQLTEGEALGHTYADATCEAPKTCSVCNGTEGEALGHTWVEATCQVVKTCSVCKKTEGELADHKWIDATTEAPKTCSVCSKTEGDRIITDSRFTTAANKDLFGTWSGIAELDCQELIGPGFTTKAKMDYAITFNPDGSYQEATTLLNEEIFIQDAEAYFLKSLYDTFEKQGLNKEQANTAMTSQYGMDAEAYAKYYINSFNWKNLLSVDVKGVYYVSEGSLYSGTTWDSKLEKDGFSITGNRLMIDSIQEQFPDLVMSRQQVEI